MRILEGKESVAYNHRCDREQDMRPVQNVQGFCNGVFFVKAAKKVKDVRGLDILLIYR